MAITQAPKFKRGDLVRFKPDSKAPQELRNLGSLWVDAVEYNGDYELLFHAGRRCYSKEHELDLVTAADPAPPGGPWGAMHDKVSKPEAPSDNLTEAGWAFDLYDDAGFLDHNDVAETIDDLNRIANGRAIRLRGKVAPKPMIDAMTVSAWLFELIEQEMASVDKLADEMPGRDTFHISNASNRAEHWRIESVGNRPGLMQFALDSNQIVRLDIHIETVTPASLDGPVPSDNLTEQYDAARQMRLMLEACRDQFNFYADNHEAKGTPESLAKANVNRLYAARITAVLRGGKA